MEDLRDKIIRTPLEPLKTFTDDPLRILRVFRFKARFGFKIDDSIIEVLRKENELKELLDVKVSRERISKEI